MTGELRELSIMKLPCGGGFDPKFGEPLWCMLTLAMGDVISGYIVVKSFGLAKLISSSKCSIVDPISIV